MEILTAIFKEASAPIYINLVVSVFVVAVIIERSIMLFFVYQIDAEAFVRVLIKLNNIDKAMKLCKSTKAPVARVCKAGLLKMNKGSMAISTAIDEEMMRVSPLLERRIGTLWPLANIATLMGLFGTILGLIRSFAALAAVSPEQKAAFLARGISEAMYNTAIGLIIAIICMTGHLILSSRSKKMGSDLEVSVATLENHLILHEEHPEQE